MYLSVATIAPRIFERRAEARAPTRPSSLARSRRSGARASRNWAQGVLEETRLSEVPPPPPATPDGIEIHQKPDGTLQVQIGTGLDIVQQGPGTGAWGPSCSARPRKSASPELAEKSVEERWAT